MSADPQEVPPTQPGSPAEPPEESPRGNPRPEIPTPMQEPGAPPSPTELPGAAPDELPVRGPSGPGSPSPATDGLNDMPGVEPDTVAPVSEPPSM